MALGTQCPCSSSWQPGGAPPHGRASNLPFELPQTQVQGAPASSMAARARPSPSMELGVAPFAARCSSSPPLGDPPDASPERVDVAASTNSGVMASYLGRFLAGDEAPLRTTNPPWAGLCTSFPPHEDTCHLKSKLVPGISRPRQVVPLITSFYPLMF
ncbi:uncharacterized protein [Zea mays]|uniref:Uncharacterized protein n=1 Tax=Zea mays TaxID=4577 RepID=C0P4I7_MAIZE|nr:uncharacterized protein LOC100272298 [Zea mays]XP_035820500.1 uncharacterized protein LOC100272298 isoform X1 [Zea mays]ACN27903.1 unknown [Zea mays]|eukprot:NP_001140256.1 uncharacterized protein LOC100272298 [Zea mays]